MKFVFFSIIAVLALVAAVLALRYSDSVIAPAATPAPQNEVVHDANVNVKTVDVLMANKDIPVGTIITSSMIEKQPWPENLVLDNFVMGEQGGQDVLGRVARSAIAAHEPLMKSKLANPNDPGFLAANLPVGMRAITVATDMVSGIAGFIFPGDRVDVLFTHENMVSTGADLQGSSGKPTSTEVLGSGIRVLAVNLREADPTKPAVVAPSSITLEVSDELSQKIRLAEKNGTLAFALRSIHDDNINQLAPSGLGDLSKYSGVDMMVVRGPGVAGGKITISNANTNANTNKNDSMPMVYSPTANPAPAANVPGAVGAGAGEAAPAVGDAIK